ncbi:hypothetical protein EYW49_15815 [Siculibacillus lacustris]|uniref:Uncharacterized protein n=1 Tax=Siculibacillus lacustris TaxID=1549641 RepID=A0A4Q9VKN5_9HYPH|nr:hypothetical protein [Siculibacillus lacustris]TBW35492.1 hypothetical protein EYW49_15815 [Siculibacillus lacustris]
MTDRNSKTNDDRTSSLRTDCGAEFHGSREPTDVRSPQRSVLCSAIALSVALLTTSPAFAVIGVGEAEIQEQQVERFLLRIIDIHGGDRVWTWDTMIHSCTKTLMYGSAEQDPEQGRVRFTADAQRFLQQCAIVKGFQPRTTPYIEPVRVEPMTYTLQRRIGILGKVLAAWVTDASRQGVTVERRDEECARWIAGQPEWQAMLIKTSGLQVGNESAAVIALLVACAQNKGFEVRPEKIGEPLKSLNEAARAEARAVKNQ